MDVRLIPATTHGRMLVREADGARGVLVGFHGYFEDAEVQMSRLERVPGAAHWTLVSLQGLHRFYKGRSESVVSSWMVRQHREVMIADNVAYVDAALASLARDPDRPLVFTGFSQGSAMAFRAAALGRGRSAGVIAVGGDVPPELLADPDVRFPRVLLMRGRDDEWYTDAKLQSDLDGLARRGAEAAHLVYAGGHDWTDEVCAAAGEFLESA